MAKKNVDIEKIDDQPVLFEELDKTPAHKAALKDYLEYEEITESRHEVLKNQKQEEDNARDKFVISMGKANLTCFEYKGKIVKLVDGKKKILIKVKKVKKENKSEDD